MTGKKSITARESEHVMGLGILSDEVLEEVSLVPCRMPALYPTGIVSNMAFGEGKSRGIVFHHGLPAPTKLVYRRDIVTLVLQR